MCGRRYLLKIKMVCGISRPTCSSSVWIGCIFIKKEAPFPLPLGLGGRSNGAWPPIKVRKSQEASLGASIFLQHLLSACCFSESSPHRAQATQRVHMSVPLSRVQLVWVIPAGQQTCEWRSFQVISTPSHLSVPSWDPSHCTADTRCHHWAVSNFLTHGICECNKMIIVLHQVGVVCHKAPGS